MNMIKRKQLYTNQTSSRWKESKQNETFYSHRWFKCCTETNLAWWPIFSAYFIPVYDSFIIIKNCGIVIEFVILAIYFWLKTTIFNVKT